MLEEGEWRRMSVGRAEECGEICIGDRDYEEGLWRKSIGEGERLGV